MRTKQHAVLVLGIFTDVPVAGAGEGHSWRHNLHFCSALYSTVQYSTVQYSTVHFCSALLILHILQPPAPSLASNQHRGGPGIASAGHGYIPCYVGYHLVMLQEYYFSLYFSKPFLIVWPFCHLLRLDIPITCSFDVIHWQSKINQLLDCLKLIEIN